MEPIMKQRIEWVDTAKAIGMFLVFYGHYIEKVSQIEGETGIAMMQLKFIYSFTMPLFFILSGFFARKHQDKLRQIKKLFLQLIIPVFAFGLLFFPLWLLFNKYRFGDFLFSEVVKRGLFYLSGTPQLDFITWFLICLFTAEVVLVLMGLPSKFKYLNLVLGFLFLTAGFLIIENIHFFSTYSEIGMNFWYIHESIIAMGFLLIGNGIFPVISALSSKKDRLFYLVIPIVTILLFLSQMYLKNEQVLIMSVSQHGDFIPFVVHSLLGSILIISVVMALPSNKLIRFIGSNTLILLGLNGIFYHFLNGFIAKWTFIDHPGYILSNSLFVSILSMALCYPAILIFNRYLPQLFGRPFVDGPILKAFRN